MSAAPPSIAQSASIAESGTDGVCGSEPAASDRTGLVARLLIWLIHVYQAARRGRPSPCRFVPTCSAYGVEALRRHGAGRGVWLTARRLGRCHPWGGHGADPVPELRNS